MIEQLPADRFAAIETLVSSAGDYPEPFSIIAGTNPGWIFVDDAHDPRAALIWSPGIEGFYLVGSEESAAFRAGLDRYVCEIISPRLLSLRWFEMSGDRDGWDRAIGKIFAGRRIEHSRQCVYRWPASWTDMRAPRREGAAPDLRRVDRTLIQNSRLLRRDFLLSKLEQFWGHAESFVAHGLGYAVVHENAIAALCLSAFVARDVHAIDVETLPEYRRRGFARTAARAFLAECRRRRLEPHWDCMKTNQASRSLAESLGLVKVREYVLHSLEETREETRS